jgi:hypothetical protein
MNSSTKGRVVQGMVPLLVAGVIFTAVVAPSYGQTNEAPTTASKGTVVAVIPLCLAKIEEARNATTIKAAENLTAALGKETTLRVLTQKEVVAAFTKSQLSYKDVTDKNLDELDKALPPHDVVVFLGPHPGKGGWFRVAVARSSDFMGRSMSVYLGDQETVSLDAKTIMDDIKGALSAPKNTKEKKE